MTDAWLLSDLIGAIYDTTLDRGLWPSVLARTADFVGGQSAAVFWNDAVAKTGDIFFRDQGIEPHYVALYFQKYVKLNPTATRHFFATVGEPLGTADLVPYDEFLDSRFYREWAHPQGLVDFVSVTLDKSLTSAAMYGVFRHERHGLVDDATRERMRLLVPHIRRAVLIARVIDKERAASGMLEAAFDGLRAATLFVDASGYVLHANTSGHSLLSKGDVLYVRSGRLGCLDLTGEAMLLETFARLGDAAPDIGTHGVAIPLTAKDGDRFVAHVLPLTTGLRSTSRPSHAAVGAIFLNAAAVESPTPPEAIAKAFSLTPSELRVLLAIVEIGGVPEVAEALGVSYLTVKTHLKHVYAKTGINRQVDLAKLWQSFASPLVNPA